MSEVSNDITEIASSSNKPKKGDSFVPKDDWRLISQGAEARLWKIPGGQGGPLMNHQGEPYIAKERFCKKYRHPVLDERLTKQRCRMEGRILEKCLKGGVVTPRVLRVEAPVLYIEYIEGMTVRDLLQEWIESSQIDDDQHVLTEGSVKEKVDNAGHVMGDIIGKVHGLGVIHGDLTTSNMMIRGNGDISFGIDVEILLIDFGLAKNSESDEDRAVDLYVLERALSSTHPSLPETFMDDIILPAYSKVAPKADKVLQRLEQVRMRGRKRECFG
mmetsp:Transcript_5829/g.11403  ORF Transcript_5829/g.11403 Transcript_5829/m.11403 type:complete len:273 (+) Transcript_5829:42-860(+)